MSNHTVRAHVRAEHPARRIIGYVWLPALFITVLALSPIINRWFAIDKSWPSFPGRILDARTLSVGPVESKYHPHVLYRLELRVSWMENGRAQDAWVPTRVTSDDQDHLRLFAAQRTTCTVRRNPHNSGYLIADLADDWQPLHPTSSQNGK
jgi:hypothetical protein